MYNSPIIKDIEIISDFKFVNFAIGNSYIYQLEKGWDDEGAEPISKNLWEKSILLIAHCMLQVFMETKELIMFPEMNPCSNQTIDIVWRSDKARLLINTSELKFFDKMSFYGDHYNDVKPIKGIHQLHDIPKELIEWMKIFK